jgi:hypothetical protein
MPILPELGRDEPYYARLANEAESAGDLHAYRAYKVAQYISLALDRDLLWPAKLRLLRHALRSHCICPNDTDTAVRTFYANLAALVRRFAGQEALRLASAEDDLYAARHALGQPRNQIEDEAEQFFEPFGLVGRCPPWFDETDFRTLKLIRDHWF